MGLCYGVPVAAGREERPVAAPLHPTRLLLLSLRCLFPCQGPEGFPPPVPSVSTDNRHIWSRWMRHSRHPEPL